MNDDTARPENPAKETSQSKASPGIRGQLILIPAATATVTAFSFVLAIIYNICYIWVIAPSSGFGPGALLSLFSIGDHLASTIEWLPLALFLAFTGVLAAHFVIHLNLSKFEEQERTEKRSQRALVLVYGLIGFSTISAISGFMLNKAVSYSWVMYVATALLGLAVVRRTRRRSVLPREQFLIGYFALMAVLWPGTLAVNKAYNDLSTLRAPFKVNHKGETHGAVLMRSLEKGMLLRFPEGNEIVFRSWEGLDEFSFAHAPVDDRSRVCVFFGWRCPKAPSGIEAGGV